MAIKAAIIFNETMIDEMIREMGGEEESRIVQIGATICVHTGPYALGVGVMKKYEACAEAGLSEEDLYPEVTGSVCLVP